MRPQTATGKDDEGRRVDKSTILLGGREVLHGLQRHYHADGTLRAEELWAEGQCYAEVDWDEQGQLRRVTHFAPNWDLDLATRCTLPPAGRSRYGPHLQLTSDGRLDANTEVVSGDYGDLDKDTPWSNGRQRHESARRDLDPATLEKLRNIKSIEDLVVTVDTPPIVFTHGFEANSLRRKGIEWNPTPELSGAPRMAPTRGRGIMVEGVPFGWWQELDAQNRVRAQGWVHHHARASPRPTPQQLALLEQQVKGMEQQLTANSAAPRMQQWLSMQQAKLDTARKAAEQPGAGPVRIRQAVRCGRWTTYTEGGWPSWIGHYDELGYDWGLFAKVDTDGEADVAMMVVGGDVRTHVTNERLQQLFAEELPLLVAR
jgi:hypothetical protein